MTIKETASIGVSCIAIAFGLIYLVQQLCMYFGGNTKDTDLQLREIAIDNNPDNDQPQNSRNQI